MTLADEIRSGKPNPWLFELAAELADEPVDRLEDDPGVITRALSSAVDLFDLPAVAVSFDPTLEPEAVGCTINSDPKGIIENVDDAFEVDIDAVTESKKVKARINAVDRLTNTCKAIILGGVTGPAMIAEQLLSDDSPSLETHEETMFTAGEIAVELTNGYLNAGADGIAVLEPTSLDTPMYQEAVEPIVNTLEHYNAESVVVRDTVTAEDIKIAGSVGFDSITGAVKNQDKTIKAALDNDIELSIGVPQEIFKKGPEAVQDFRTNAPAGGSLSSQWTVPVGTAPETVHELMKSL